MAGGVIVVGVDGSEAAQRALRWAVAEARARHGALHAVHAWTFGSMADFRWTSRPTLRAESRALLRAAVRDAGASSGLEVVCRSVEGSAWRVLLDASRDATLLVLGASRRHGQPRRSVGSVTALCARHATGPIVVVPTPAGLGRGEHQLTHEVAARG